MHRIFLGLVVTDATLLLVTFGLGFLAPLGPVGKVRLWHDLHFLVGLFTVMFTLMVHSIAYTYFIGTGKWVKEVVRVYGLPAWVEAQSKKNKRRAFPFVFWSMMAIGAAAWLGAAVDTRKDFNPLWHLGASSLAMAFNLGAFAAEYAVIVAQARLILEVKDQADRLRLTQQAEGEAVAAGPAGVAE